jgi:hypothetical protein
VKNQSHQPIFMPLSWRLGSVSSDFVETLAAIYRSAFTGFKRYFGFFAALGTNCGEHLAHSGAAHALGLPCLSAGGASFGLVGVTLGLEKFLFSGRENKLVSAVGTL